MKITEEFPLTVPQLSVAHRLNPAVLLALMPAPHHLSGRTPRWRRVTAPAAWTHVISMPHGSREPKIVKARDLSRGDARDVVCWCSTEASAHSLMSSYMLNFWSIKSGDERVWLKARQEAP